MRFQQKTGLFSSPVGGISESQLLTIVYHPQILESYKP